MAKFTTIRKKLREIVIPGASIKVYIRYDFPDNKGRIDSYKIYISDAIRIPSGIDSDEFRDIILNNFSKRGVDISEFEWLISDNPFVVDTSAKNIMLVIQGKVKNTNGRNSHEECKRTSQNDKTSASI